MNAGPLAFARFDLGDVGAAVAPDAAQLIEFRVDSFPNDAAVGKLDGRLIGESQQNRLADIPQLVEAFMKLNHARGLKIPDQRPQDRQ